MAVLDDLLDDIRAQRALISRSVMEPRWSLRVADGSPLALVTPLRGHAWIVPDDAEPVRVDEGDVGIISRPTAYTVADDPSYATTLIAAPQGRFALPDGTDITDEVRAAQTTGQPDPTGATVLVCGTYEAHGDVSARLLSALPPQLVVHGDDTPRWAIDALAAEVGGDDPGRQVIVDRLLDLTLILTLRAWFTRDDTHAPAWFRAHHDPVVGHALRLIHGDPAHGWTVAGLADAAGVSRAWFARRFAVVMGEPPMSYLAGWRIARAADLLTSSDATVETIARRVGYANAFTFSTAFTRVKGISPSRYRSSAPPRQQASTGRSMAASTGR